VEYVLGCLFSPIVMKQNVALHKCCPIVFLKNTRRRVGKGNLKYENTALLYLHLSAAFHLAQPRTAGVR
jgi:hypothetical protein